MNELSGEIVEAFARGLRVIECFGADARRLTLTDVANRTGYSRATARRLLLTLQSLGYAETDGKHFALTPRVLDLGFSYINSLGFADHARPHLEMVTDRLNESCSLAVLDGQQIVYVARSAAPHRIMSVALTVGTRLPANATSMGQVLLAHLPDLRLRDYIANARLEARTRFSIVDRADLRLRLAAVREKGYALVDQELEEGLKSLAVPIFRNDGTVCAALNVSTQSARFSDGRMIRELLPTLQDAARRIGETQT